MATAVPNGAKAPSNLAVRIFCLAALLVLIHAWAVAHLGAPIETILKIEVGVAIIGTLTQVLTKKQRERFTRDLRAIVFRLLGTSVLLTLFLIFAVAGSVITSVMVSAAGAEGLGEVTLLSPVEDIDTKPLATATDQQRFLVPVGPFGRALYLRVDGYQRLPINVYPWVPTRIQIPFDMRLAPTILLRMPAVRVSYPGLRFELTKPAGLSRGAVIAEVSVMPEGSMSLMVGPDRPVPYGFVPIWERQVRAAERSGTLDQIIGEWLTPVVLPAGQPIEAGTRLKASLFGQPNEPGKPGDLLAEKLFTVRTDAVQDILLVNKPEKAAAPPKGPS